MPAPGRLVLLLLLAPACFHDTPPELIATSGGTDATSTSTDATSSETSEPVTSTGEPNSSTSTGTSTSPSSTSTTTSTSETGCTETSWYLDLDMDGHGDPNTLMLACVSPTGHVELGDDCDDGDGARAPGLPELCDGKDNDCDPLVDEYSEANTSCNNCALRATPWSSYAYCVDALPWGEARVACQKLGGDLAVIDDEMENAVLTQQGLDLSDQDGQWYFGINDLKQEDKFVWLDGGPVGATFWGDGEPSDTGDEDCGVLLVGSGTWNDGACDVPIAFICEAAIGP